MRKTIFYVSVFAVLFSVVSCGNDDERIREEIIGSYRYTNEKESSVLSATIEGVETFNDDGTVDDRSIISVSFSKEGLGEANLSYQMSFTGKYEINNSCIVYDYSDIENNGSVELLSAEGSEGSSEFIEELTSQLESTLLTTFKEGMGNQNGIDIYELTEERLVILNPEGEKIIKTRIVE